MEMRTSHQKIARSGYCAVLTASLHGWPTVSVNLFERKALLHTKELTLILLIQERRLALACTSMRKGSNTTVFVSNVLCFIFELL